MPTGGKCLAVDHAYPVDGSGYQGWPARLEEPVLDMLNWQGQGAALGRATAIPAPARIRHLSLQGPLGHHGPSTNRP